jgi:Domain of unknown function (DUF6471)
MGFAKDEDELRDRLSRYMKAELKRAGVTYADHAKRLSRHGLKGETEVSVKNKVIRGTYPATFLIASLAALEREGLRLEDV